MSPQVLKPVCKTPSNMAQPRFPALLSNTPIRETSTPADWFTYLLLKMSHMVLLPFFCSCYNLSFDHSHSSPLRQVITSFGLQILSYLFLKCTSVYKDLSLKFLAHTEFPTIWSLNRTNIMILCVFSIIACNGQCLCVNLIGLRDPQIAGKTLFLSVSCICLQDRLAFESTDWVKITFTNMVNCQRMD